jgi:hypothetical protein
MHLGVDGHSSAPERHGCSQGTEPLADLRPIHEDDQALRVADENRRHGAIETWQLQVEPRVAQEPIDALDAVFDASSAVDRSAKPTPCQSTSPKKCCDDDENGIEPRTVYRVETTTENSS